MLAAILALRDRTQPNRRIVAALVALPLISVALFPVQYKFHDYYLVALTPSFAILIAVGFERLTQRRTLRGPISLGVRGLTILIVVVAAAHPAQRALAAERFARVQELQRRAELINAAAPNGEPLGILTNSWNPSLAYLLDRDVFIAWDKQSIMTANWSQRGVHEVAIGFGPPGMLFQVDDPWIGTDGPVLISLADTQSELRDSTVAGTSTDVLAESAASNIITCGPEGVAGPTPNAAFVVRPVDTGSQTLIRFGDVVPIPIRHGAVIRPDRQPHGSQLICPLGRTKLYVGTEVPVG